MNDIAEKDTGISARVLTRVGSLSHDVDSGLRGARRSVARVLKLPIVVAAQASNIAMGMVSLSVLAAIEGV